MKNKFTTIIETEIKIDTPKNVHDSSLSWLGTSGRVKLILWVHGENMRFASGLIQSVPLINFGRLT
jgi:hypothetical protein